MKSFLATVGLFSSRLCPVHGFWENIIADIEILFEKEPLCTLPPTNCVFPFTLEADGPRGAYEHYSCLPSQGGTYHWCSTAKVYPDIPSYDFITRWGAWEKCTPSRDAKACIRATSRALDDALLPGPVRRPLVYFPGLLASNLYLDTELPKGDPCKHFYKKGHRVWFPTGKEIPRLGAKKAADRCLLKLMEVERKKDGSYDGLEGIKLRPRHRSFEDAIPHQTDVLLKILEAVGYEENKNMIAQTYDWRLSPEKLIERDDLCQLAKTRIENLVRDNGDVPAVLVAHSYGGLVQMTCMWSIMDQLGNEQGPAWLARNIDAMVSVGTPYLGSLAPMQFFHYPNTFFLSTQLTLQLRRVTKSWLSMGYMLPIGGTQTWGGRHHPLITYKDKREGKSLTVPEYCRHAEHFLPEFDSTPCVRPSWLGDGKPSSKRVKEDLKSSYPPWDHLGRPQLPVRNLYCMMGHHVDPKTPYHFIFDQSSQNSTDVGDASIVDTKYNFQGDSAVSTPSAGGLCNLWKHRREYRYDQNVPNNVTLIQFNQTRFKGENDIYTRAEHKFLMMNVNVIFDIMRILTSKEGTAPELPGRDILDDDTRQLYLDLEHRLERDGHFSPDGWHVNHNLV